MLVDPIQRRKYDMRCYAAMKQTKPKPTRNRNAREEPGVHPHPGNPQQSNQQVQQVQQQQQQKTQPEVSNGRFSFWTECPFCNVRLEYEIQYLGKALRCPTPTCKRIFTGHELGPRGMASVANESFAQKKEDPRQGGHKTGSEESVMKVGGDSEAKGREDANLHNGDVNKANGMPKEKKPSGNGTRTKKRGRKPTSNCGSPKKSRVIKPSNAAQDHIGTATEKDASKTQTGTTIRKDASKTDEALDPSADLKENMVERHKERTQHEKSFLNGNNGADACNNGKEEAVEADKVPLAGFYDFNKDKSFAAGQIWAIHDHFDGMPRFYARIRKVFSSDFKFKVRMTLLEADSDDQDVIDWMTEDLPVACGKFKHSKHEHSEDPSMFSHRVEWEKILGRCPYMIYPRKGETWALYKNWDIRWSSDPENHRNYEYEFVEVHSDYNEESGIKIAYLVKIRGFVNLFRPTVANGVNLLHIPPNEILRFSHRVPSYRTSGEEREDVCEGYFELDPASLPSDIEKFSDPINVEVNIGRGDTDSNGLLNSPQMERTSNPQQNRNPDENAGQPIQRKSFGSDTVNNPDGLDTMGSVERQGSTSPSCVDPFKSNSETLYYYFEKDKVREKFVRGQIWAMYCEHDGLPKFYAHIKKVELSPVFKLQVRWLEPCGPPKGATRWLDKEIPICCGTFKYGEKSEFDDTLSFSHMSRPVTLSKTKKFEIYPRKGEVWALYKNFNPELSHLNLHKCEYEFVEVREVKPQLIEVLVLEQDHEVVVHYGSIFNSKRNGQEFTMEIPAVDLLRFSHQVPAFPLTNKVDEKLQGCWELDPKALPESYMIN
ncbi:hypothetical protein MKW94_030136 [Papaver nudicaule]|uniref:DUF3444 domain-containing protein n=1 Tax=Papaver nudicaule TaxID=74823 RepID=A0AA41S636_PAPNU|nr:hypothetical protein [Papaver nudicaule]